MMSRPITGLSILILFAAAALLLIPLTGRPEVAGSAAPADWVQLYNDNGDPYGANTGMAEGYIVGAVLQGGDELFPLAVRSVQALFYRNFPYADPTAYVRAVIYSIGPGGLPEILLGASAPVTVTTFWPDGWADLPLAVPVTLASSQQFLAGIEYLAGDKGTTPCVIVDSSTTIPYGKNFYSRDAGETWIEHYDFWVQGWTVGYNMVRAMVEPNIWPYTGTPPPTRTPTATPTATPLLSPTATATPITEALWPGNAIGYGKQHVMARGPDGRRHIIYMGPDSRSLYYAWSDDNGHTWQPELAARTPIHTFEQPGAGGSLGLDPDGQGLHLVVGQDRSSTPPDGGINAALYFHYRGGVWSAPERIASGGFGYNLAVGPDGRVHVAWSDSDVWYRVRATNGVWSRARRLTTNGWHPDVDVGSDGRVHVAYNDNDYCCSATWVEVRYLRSDDGGQTWEASERVTYDSTWSGAAVGAADAQGRYHIAYFVSTPGGGDLYYRIRETDGRWTNPRLLYHGVPTGQTGAESPSLEVDDAGDSVMLFRCQTPGQPSNVCLLARDDWCGWQDPRLLAIYGLVAPSLAGGRLDPTWVDVLWSSEGQLIYRAIRDLRFCSAPTPTPTPTATPGQFHVRVVDDQGEPRSGARVYRNGVFAGLTRPDGVLDFDRLDAGDELIVLAPLPLDAAATSGRTTRPGHDRDLDGEPAEPWAFRVYLTNLRQSPDLGPQPPGLLPDGAPGERLLVVRRDSPLILLNLTISVEWDADGAYLDDLETGLRQASAFLYDVSDGQMALGRVTLFDRGERWADADVRIAANNMVYPHAAVGGIAAGRADYDVRLGPLWNGHSGRRTAAGDGPWSRLPGYRTIVHELGHYVLGLYDEYIYYVVVGGVLRDLDAYCTHSTVPTPSVTPPPEPNRASIMDNQLLASELADVRLSALWSDACEHTEQWARNAESDWDTVLRLFRATDGPAMLACRPDATGSAAYCLWRPGSRGSLVPQPTPDPPVARVWPWPAVVRAATTDGPPQRTLQVQWSGTPQAGRSYALRAVVRQMEAGRLVYVEQGFTGPDDSIALFGAAEGATLLLNTLDRSVQTNVPIGASPIITLTLQRPAWASAAGGTGLPQLYLSPAADGEGVRVTVAGLVAAAAPQVEYTLAGEPAQRIAMSQVRDVWEATVPVDLRFRASGTVAILGADGQPLGPHLSAAFAGRGLAAPAPADVFSADGRLWLHLPEGSLAQDTFVLVSSFGGLPGDWPAGWAPAGPAYAVNYPAGQPAPAGRLRLRPDPGQLAVRPAEPVTLVGRPEDTPAWCRLPTAASEPDNSVSTAWGAGLVAAAWPAETRVYLPLVQR